MPKVKIITEKEVMPPLEILAEQIEAIAKLGLEIKNSRLTQDAIVTLLKAKTGEHKISIIKILDALPALKDYLKTNKFQK